MIARGISLVVSLLSAPALAQTVREESILPAATDPAISIALSAHRAAFVTGAPPRGQLFVYLHGAGGTAGSGTLLLRAAAELGFHAVGITYPMDQTPFQFCATDFACQELFRREIIEGGDFSPHIGISRANSVESRLIRLLTFLDSLHPGEGWGEFAPSGAIAWNGIVLYGHSMGGANAALIARDHELAGACISAPAADIQGWWSTPSTPVARIFGFSHTQDRFMQLQGVWGVMGLTLFGPVRDVASTVPPYMSTHILSTSIAPVGGDFHNSPTTDGATPRLPDGTPLYKPVWSYMMQGGMTQPPACPADANNDGMVGLGDVAVIIENWGRIGDAGLFGDLNADGLRGLADVALVINAWGKSCP